MSDLRNKRVLVVGLAKSGMAAARLAIEKGATVTAADRRSAAELGEAAAALERLGAKLALGPHDARLFADTDLMVVSPGVPLALPEIQAARRAGVRVVGEVELASWALSGALIGVTGTNGKSTVTALTGCLCESSGARTFAGGNLGKPLSEAALRGGGFDYVVCELSSFQLEGIERLRPRVACITNLTPDHIDRYPSHEAYGLAKKRIFMNQTEADFGVVNARDAATLKLVEGERCRPVTFGFGAPADWAARFDGERIVVRIGQGDERYFVRNRALRGEHNVENAMVAVLAARLAGVLPEHVQAGLDRYPGLAHRVESAGTVGGIEYVNDSKATNVDSTIVALKAFPRGVWLIAGGRGKGVSYAPMVAASRGRVEAVLTIGEDAPRIAEAYRGEVEVVDCGDLAGALRVASERAKPGDVVLLSPACASYDQFHNFEERGERFKALVRKLAGEAEGK
ncbi:MAG: UDP-N-acetylmuramoyl-L-alanine--D-glutamate ligase [Myxococcales bacterium]|jgi:UDP-N-acetylmuramoylalanine--D-glutamate ligase